jgi:glutathione synthase/RimK-type ligase-like ATP-grasp enzyme
MERLKTPLGNVCIATFAQLPQLDPDDHLLVRALEDLGFGVSFAVWNEPSVDWARSDACLIRSTWDYHKHAGAFLRWAETVSAQTCILNPLELIRWNLHKFYLRDLEKAGVPVVPTVWLESGCAVTLQHILDRNRWPDAVIKPAYGASADGVLHVRSDSSTFDRAQRYLARLLLEQDVLVQPYVSTIDTHHERALVFIDGVYSHAVTKMPFMHANSDLAGRASLPPGTSGEPPVEPTRHELDVATMAMGACPPGHVFARVDLVHHDGAAHVLEMELIEPALYFYAKPSAARDLAAVIARRIGSAPPSTMSLRRLENERGVDAAESGRVADDDARA